MFIMFPFIELHSPGGREREREKGTQAGKHELIGKFFRIAINIFSHRYIAPTVTSLKTDSCHEHNKISGFN